RQFEEAQRGIDSQAYACTTQSKPSGYQICVERFVNISYYYTNILSCCWSWRIRYDLQTLK
ncbi:hypothetical protein WUBG_17134, partial [Wuchereria bancrofti]